MGKGLRLRSQEIHLTKKRKGCSLVGPPLMIFCTLKLTWRVYKKEVLLIMQGTNSPYPKQSYNPFPCMGTPFTFINHLLYKTMNKYWMQILISFIYNVYTLLDHLISKRTFSGPMPLVHCLATWSPSPLWRQGWRDQLLYIHYLSFFSQTQTQTLSHKSRKKKKKEYTKRWPRRRSSRLSPGIISRWRPMRARRTRRASSPSCSGMVALFMMHGLAVLLIRYI